LNFIIDKNPEEQNKFLLLPKIKIVSFKNLQTGYYEYIIFFLWNKKKFTIKAKVDWFYIVCLKFFSPSKYPCTAKIPHA
jgi:hypothetical protein